MTDKPDQFPKKSEELTRQSLRAGGELLGQDMDWTTRYARFGWGKGILSQARNIFVQKTEQAEREFQLILDQQVGERAELNTIILKAQEIVMNGIRSRFHIIMSLSVVESQAGKRDDQVSTNYDLAALKGQGLALMQAMDVQRLVYDALPKSMKETYLEMIGKNIQEELTPDLFKIIERLDRGEAFTEEDWAILAKEILKKQEGMERTAAILILATLKPKERFQLLILTAKIASAAEYGELLVHLTGFGYITRDQANLLIDKRLETATSDEKGTLAQARTILGGEAIEKMQQALIARRKEGVRRMGRVSYGHKNRARGLLTLQGIGGMFLTVNGALTMAVNVAVDPLTFVGNPAFLLGLAETSAGLEMTHGFEGLIPKPTELAALALKDRDEEKNDKAQLNLIDFRNELFNHPDSALFYVNYAQNIVQAFEEKRKNTAFPDIKITLEDLGVKSREALPIELRDLWAHKGSLEADISKWAIRFFRNSGNGIGLRTWEEQRNWIQNERMEMTGGGGTGGIGQRFTIYEKPPLFAE